MMVNVILEISNSSFVGLSLVALTVGKASSIYAGERKIKCFTILKKNRTQPVTTNVLLF
jgi:hypothetical protein